MMKKIEIACCNFESCQNAEKAGADRIELFENPSEGGSTPSYGMIKKVKEKINLPIYVMIRPRGGNFYYTEDEFAIMKADVMMCKELRADGIVFGMLNKRNEIDVERCKILLDIWQNAAATFHRAIDVTKDLCASTQQIIQLGFERILTSGGKKNALDGCKDILTLHERFKNNISIMAGSGITPENVHHFSSLDEVHATCKKVAYTSEMFGSYSLSDEQIISRLVGHFKS